MKEEKLKIGDWCISVLLNPKHPLFLQILFVPAKIVDISEHLIKLKLLSGEIVECSMNESLIIITDSTNVMMTAGHMLYLAQTKLEQNEEALFNAQLDMDYDIKGPLTQSEYEKLETGQEEALQEITKLKKVFEELGILKNFTQIIE